MDCAKKTVSTDQLLDPSASAWSGIPGEALALVPTPLASQPSEYIRASRDAATIGKVRDLLVQSVHNGSDILFRLTWMDETRNDAITDSNVFPDGCGILMPLAGGNPSIDEMGSKAAPVNAWFWRADIEGAARNVIAQGLGTTEATARSVIRARAVWGHGAWAVVFARALAVPDQKDETVQLAPGTDVEIAFAVWEGSNGERGGIKSFSKEWRTLTLAA